MAFSWPPTVKYTNIDAALTGYCYDDMASRIVGGLAADTVQGRYLTGGLDTFSGQNKTYFRSWMKASDGAFNVGSPGDNVDVVWNTYNGQSVMTGTSNLRPSGIYRVCPDYSTNLAAYFCDDSVGLQYRTIVAFHDGTVAPRFFASPAYTYNTALTSITYPLVFGVASGTATKFYSFRNAEIQTGSSMGSAVYKTFMYWTMYDRDSSAAPVEANLISPVASTPQIGLCMFDAGEGYYYILSNDNGLLAIRGVDLSGGGTPVVTGLLGGSGTSGWAPDMPRQVNLRYITIGSNRVICIQTNTDFITITFTTGTKTTPTIVKTARACTHTSVVVEYDPAAQEAYVVGLSVSENTRPIVVSGGFAPLSPPGTAFSAATNIASYTPNSANGVMRYHSFGCAQVGGAMESGLCASTAYVGSQMKQTGVGWNCWATSTTHEVGVPISTTYSGMSASRELIQQRNATMGPRGSMSAGVQIMAAHSENFQWNLNANTGEITVGVEMSSTYSSVSADATIQVTVEVEPLTQHWTTVGYTFMDDFMVYINADRAAAGLPPYKTWGKDGQYIDRKDMAVLHSDQMAWLRVYAHESTAFPPLRRTIPERRDMMPATGLAENLLFSPWLDLQLQYNYGYLSAYDMWQLWHDSPTHYANIVRNWGSPADNDKVYSVLGVADGRPPPEYPDYEPYQVIYATNIFVLLETVMYETSLQQNWSNTGGLLSVLPQQWSNDAWEKVRATNSAPYALRVSAQFEAKWGCRVGAQHSAPITFSAAAQHSAPYGATAPIGAVGMQLPYAIRNTQPVATQHDAEWSMRVGTSHGTSYSLLTRVASSVESGYSIKNTEPVRAANQLSYSVSVAQQHEVPFAVMHRVSGQHSTNYAVYDTQPVTQQHEVSFGMGVSSSLSTDWSLMAPVRRQHTTPYGDRVGVRTQQSIDYAMLASDPVHVVMSHYYELTGGPTALFPTGNVTVTLSDGTTFPVDDAVISNAQNDTGYSFECAITDLAVFSRVQEDDPFTVNFCGEVYHFLLQSKSFTRDSPSGVAFRLKGDNAVMRQGAPYAPEAAFVQESEALASALVAQLVEIDFTFQIVDWLIPAGRLQAAGATPLEAVRQIAEAAGGVVDGDIDGSMVLRFPYPHPMNRLDEATIQQAYSDTYDNLSVSSQTEYRSGANRFRVREGDASFADQFEWVADDYQPDPQFEVGTLKAYLSPYRHTATIKHLGNAINVYSTGEQVELREELVEFNEGAGNTQRPIHELLSVEWFTASLGAPSFAFYSTLLNVNPTVNGGYGLAKVTYNAKHLTARATGVPASVESGKVGPASSYAYFTLEENNG